MKKKRVKKYAKIALLVYVIIGLSLYFSQKLFLFHGKILSKDYVYKFVEQDFSEINIKRSNGTNLNCIRFLPSDTGHPVGVVIYYHGNKHNINRYAPYARRFTANGFVVYMPDYPGFGKSTGKITEEIMKADATTIYKLAKQTYDTLPFLVYGKSMGTGLASYIAAHNNVNRLVLETPYYSLPTVYDNFTWIYPTKLMLKFHFNNYVEMPKVKAPITIFHGTLDKLISINNASNLKPFLKPNDEFVTIPYATHNNIVDYPIYTEKIDSVLSIVENEKAPRKELCN